VSYWHCRHCIWSRVYASVGHLFVLMSVHLSVRPIRLLMQVCSLLLRARRAGTSIDCCTAGMQWVNVGSATLSAEHRLVLHGQEIRERSWSIVLNVNSGCAAYLTANSMLTEINDLHRSRAVRQLLQLVLSQSCSLCPHHNVRTASEILLYLYHRQAPPGDHIVQK